MRRTFFFGLLLIPVLFLALFLLSIIFGTEQPMDFLAANVIAMVVVAAVAFGIARRLSIPTRRQGIVAGLVWAGTMFVVLLVTGIGNGTTHIIFGTWSAYLWYLGAFEGAVHGSGHGSTPSTKSLPTP